MILLAMLNYMMQRVLVMCVYYTSILPTIVSLMFVVDAVSVIMSIVVTSLFMCLSYFSLGNLSLSFSGFDLTSSNNSQVFFF